MTVSTTANKVIYSGNAATTVWSYTFPIPDATFLSVIYTDASGVETTLSSSLYSVTGIGTKTGGTVTYPTSGSPIASGTKLTILRTVPYTQPDVFSNQGGYFPEVTEGRFDRVTMILQQLLEKVTRGLFAPVSDSGTIGDLPTSTTRANSGAGSFLAFDSSGNPYAAALTALAGASTWITANLFPATSAAAARTAIGAAGLTGNETIAGNKTFSGASTFSSTVDMTGATATVPTQAPEDSSTKAASTAFAAGLLPKGHISALTLSTAGSSSTFSVAAGQAADSANAVLISLAASISKTTGAWAVGTGNGALDTGSIANNTGYHVYLIRRPDTGVVDVLISTSASGPAMPTNYTQKRRIGWMRTNGSAQWTSFVQNGDNFKWVTPVADASSVVGATSRQTQTLTVPSGVVVFPILLASATSGGSGGCTMLLTSLDETDSGITGTLNNSSVGGAATNGTVVEINGLHTNTSAQIGKKINTTDSAINITTMGWVDMRGRNG